jgi:predicted NAD/FAD-dependent oxidoreductase
LWTTASEVDRRLFDLDRADVVHLVRWPHAVPIVDPGYYRRLEQLVQTPPLVYAGDWLVQPCVEGAVRSGEAAARHFPPAARRRDQDLSSP